MSAVPTPSADRAPVVTGSGLPALDDTYRRELDGLSVPWEPTSASAPTVVRVNRALAAELGADADRLASPAGASVLAGAAVPDGAHPIAQAYAGHQFGNFVPLLGDGRAAVLGEVVDVHGARRDIGLKGSGPTVFSRGGDGRAALGPVLREYLMGEAMTALGVPTTRALAVVRTGDPVWRDGEVPGAVLTRVAASHLRVGTFALSAAHDHELTRRLADYAVARHYPEVADAEDPYVALLAAVARRQARTVARWMDVGFVHGVMNTDNTTISGETIDYGPCAFVDTYDPRAVFSSIDHAGRYALGNQPGVLQWNLSRFAETLVGLSAERPGPDGSPQGTDRAVERMIAVLEDFARDYQAFRDEGVAAKLGLRAQDRALGEDFLTLLHTHGVDHTSAFRRLADLPAGGDDAVFRSLWPAEARADLDTWLARWRAAAGADADRESTRDRMRAVNPIYIPRNHLVEEALTAAVRDADLAPFDALSDVLADPFTERPGLERYAQPAPRGFADGYRTFCGT